LFSRSQHLNLLTQSQFLILISQGLAFSHFTFTNPGYHSNLHIYEVTLLSYYKWIKKTTLIDFQ